MGLDIGFNLYKKEPLDERGEFVEADVQGIDNWACGWSAPTEAWGSLFYFDEHSSIVPVFQKGITVRGRQVLEEYSEEYKLVDFEDFASPIEDAVANVAEEAKEERIRKAKEIERLKRDNKSLRELQKGCTEDQQYAFDRWDEEIRSNKERLELLEESLADDDDYELSYARRVTELLKEMKGFVDRDEYYVIPFYSC